MSECRSLTNFIGNAVACVIVTIWEGRLDRAEFDAALAGRMPSVDELEPGVVAA
jgi:aerobic C4-dicarboxylate transport protein